MECEECDTHLFSKPQFAELESIVGVTSRVKRRGRCFGHYLLFDVDSVSSFSALLRWLSRRKLFGDGVADFFYRTEHGYHLMVYIKHSKEEAYHILKECPYVDQKWVELGYKRGYWFLASVEQHLFPVPMEYMKVRRVRKSAEGL